MTAIVYAARPFRPGPAQLRNWSRHGLRWVGWNGAEFNLRDLRGGVIVTDEGLLGLHTPPIEALTSVSPATSGRRRLDARVLERPVKLPVYLWSDDGSPEWALLYRRFFDSFHPTRPGRLELTTPLGEVTLTELYLDSSGDFQLTHDPLYQGFMRCDVQLTAEDPWFYGEPVTRSWEIGEQVPFFNVSNLWVSDGPTFEAARIGNPGNVPAWAQIVVEAGGTALDATVTIDGGVIGCPTVPAGQTLTIDTEQQVATMNGVDVTDDVNPYDPAPIPDGDDVPIQLELNGLGRVTVTIRPKFFRWM